MKGAENHFHQDTTERTRTGIPKKTIIIIIFKSYIIVVSTKCELNFAKFKFISKFLSTFIKRIKKIKSNVLQASFSKTKI
jgi:hypothetical protein